MPSAKAEDIQRHDAVIRYLYNDILNGVQQSILVNNLLEDKYRVDYKYARQTALNLIVEARKLMKDDYQKEMEEMRGDIVMKYMDIYYESRQAVDRLNARQALDSIVKLTGIAEPERINLNGDFEIQIEFKDKKTKTDE